MSHRGSVPEALCIRSALPNRGSVPMGLLACQHGHFSAVLSPRKPNKSRFSRDPVVRSLQRGDIELSHLQHRLYGTACFLGIGGAEQLAKD